MSHDFRRILIVRTDRIGDVLLTLPMAELLKRLYPAAEIGMLIQRYTAELVEGNRAVDRILYYDDGRRPVPFFRLIARLRSHRFDVVFHTHPMFRLALITWLARIPIRVGTGYRWYSFLFSRKVYEHRKDAARHELEYNINLLKALGAPVAGYDGIAPSLEVTPEAMRRVEGLLGERGIGADERIVILHPGSGGSARDWSSQNFARLGRCLSGLPRVRVVVTGGASEAGLVREVQAGAGEGALAIVNDLNLREFAALAKLSSLFVANSTGPLHMAAAVGTPVIGLYPHIKPLSAARWGPYTAKKTIFSPVGKPEDCSLCLRHGPCECMAAISVEEVFTAARRYVSP